MPGHGGSVSSVRVLPMQALLRDALAAALGAGTACLGAAPVPASAPPSCATIATVAALGAASPEFLDVEIIRSSGGSEAARRGSTLCDLDRLRTGFRSHATLEVGGQATIRVAELSGVYVAGFQLDPSPELTLWLRRGEITVTPAAAAAPLRLRLVSPTATVTASGSRVGLAYDPVSPRETRVAAIRGVVVATPTRGPFRDAVSNGLRPVTLRPGQEVAVRERAVSPVDAIGRAGVPRGWIARALARETVLGILERNHEACRMTVHAISVRTGAEGWLVAVKLAAGGRTAWGGWSFAGSEIRHTNPFATFVSRRCR